MYLRVFPLQGRIKRLGILTEESASQEHLSCSIESHEPKKKRLAQAKMLKDSRDLRGCDRGKFMLQLVEQNASVPSNLDSPSPAL